MRTKRAAFQILLANARYPSMRPTPSLMSRPCPAIDASVNRSASAPCFAVMSSGSMTFPRVFDIFSPFSSRTIACRNTVRNGTCPMKCRPSIAMRATQKKRMSKPVSITEFG